MFSSPCWNMKQELSEKSKFSLIQVIKIVTRYLHPDIIKIKIEFS